MADRCPRFFARDVLRIGRDGLVLGKLGGGEDGEEDEGFGVGVVGGVDRSGGDVGHFAGTQDAVFLPDPLLGPTVKDVDDFFPVGVDVEGVTPPRGHVGADEQELVRPDHIGPAEPFVVGPGIRLPEGVGDLDKKAVLRGRRGGLGHGEDIMTWPVAWGRAENVLNSVTLCPFSDKTRLKAAEPS